jgi:magnesium transporter
MSVRAFRLTDDRSLKECEVDDVVGCADKSSVCWVDILQGGTDSPAECLRSLEFHPLAIAACSDLAPAARLVVYGKSLFMGLPTLTAWDGADRAFLFVVCLPGMLVTIHKTEIPALSHLFEQYTEGMRFHGDSTSAIFYQIIDHIIDEDVAFTLRTRDEVARLDNLLEADSVDGLSRQSRPLKRRLARLVATFEDQLYCVGTLQTIESGSFRVEGSQDYFRDAVSHLDHASRVANRQLAHMDAIQQEYQLKLQNKANDRLRLLTVVSTIFIPLSLIAGIYGMNFRNMPELHWQHAYFGVLGTMVILASGMLWGFYRAGWFR